MSSQPVLPLKDFKFDVIVGNPPWGAAGSSDNQLATKWCKAFRYPVGDRELSQCFMWRVQRLLKPGGQIGLLVSTGILFKHGDKSREFRRRWLQENRIRAVYNFAHVRQVFFRKQREGAIAPFAAVFFAPASVEEALQNRVSYVSIKQSAFVERLQAVVIDRTDLCKARQRDFLANDWLWKTYMWGGLNDVGLIGELQSCYKSLKDVVSDCSRGYKSGGTPKRHSTHELGVDFELDADLFYQNSELLAPIKHRPIHRSGSLAIYKGPRLLVKRGIPRSGEKFGELKARLAYTPFAFTSSIIGFRLKTLDREKHQVLLGIVLSSLAKYYHFMTCSTWGFWHYEIHEQEHLGLPIHFPDNRDLRDRILKAVEQITTESDTPTLFEPDSPGWRVMQDELDEAIFDLYGLSDAQRDLVRDLCQVTLEFFYEGVDSKATKPPAIAQLEEYRDVFLQVWQERLASKGKELEARIYAPHHGLLVGVSFDLKDSGTAVHHASITDNSEWQRWFRRLSQSLLEEYARRIYIDRVVKELSESSMFIIKRAQRRFWTKSQARRDAQELLTEVFRLEWQRSEGSLG